MDYVGFMEWTQHVHEEGVKGNYPNGTQPNNQLLLLTSSIVQQELPEEFPHVHREKT